jgi:hypothetical protein
VAGIAAAGELGGALDNVVAQTQSGERHERHQVRVVVEAQPDAQGVRYMGGGGGGCGAHMLPKPLAKKRSLGPKNKRRSMAWRKRA